MSYTAPQGDQVALPLAYAYTAPTGDAVALPMPDGFVETLGNARFGASIPAGLVVAFDLAGVEIDRATPDPASTPVGNYSFVSDRGPVLIVAHRFDPADWKGIWKPSTAFALGDVVFSNGATTSESFALRCTTAGTTDATEPAWNEQVGGSNVDGSASWETLGRIRDVAPITNFHIVE